MQCIVFAINIGACVLHFRYIRRKKSKYSLSSFQLTNCTASKMLKFSVPELSMSVSIDASSNVNQVHNLRRLKILKSICLLYFVSNRSRRDWYIKSVAILKNPSSSSQDFVQSQNLGNKSINILCVDYRWKFT